MKTVLCFGELLLRVSPALNNDSENQPFILYMGGAEANVATALAGWNVPVSYCTALPDNFMAKHITDYLENQGIDVSNIVYAGDRIGLYYLERGADLKGSMVYDRAGSSFSNLKRGSIDWDKVFRDVSWFNITAISPALNEGVADLCLEALEVASEKGITISMDLNYRSRLWNYGKDPVQVMPQLAEYCDVLMGNIWAANSLLGIAIDEDIHSKNSKAAYLDHALKTSRSIMDQFPKCKVVANTFRFDKQENNILYYTTMATGNQFFESPEFSCEGVIDRSGSGDCFMAGLIYGLHNKHMPQELLNYASAAAFGKLQEQGDATDQDVLTVSQLKNKTKISSGGS